MKILSLLLLTTLSIYLSAQPNEAPIIKDFGKIYAIPEAEELPQPDLNYKIVIDIKSGSSYEALNSALNNIARMMNLHGVGGVPANQLEVVGVIHAGATSSVLTDESFNSRYGRDNPNVKIIEALTTAGVKLFVCGQSMIGRGFQFEELNPKIKLSISALTVLTTYQMLGYKPLVF